MVQARVCCKGEKVNEEYQASPCETLENTSQDHIIIDSLYDSISKYVNEIGGEYYKGWLVCWFVGWLVR